jgi:hypothetical protein
MEFAAICGVPYLADSGRAGIPSGPIHRMRVAGITDLAAKPAGYYWR